MMKRQPTHRRRRRFSTETETENRRTVWITLMDELKSWSVPFWMRNLQLLGLDVRRDVYSDYPEEDEKMSLSKCPFELGTLLKVCPRKPFRGSIDVELWDRVYNSVSHRRAADAQPRRVPGRGYWTVVERHSIRGVGWWHKIVRGDGEMGWVEDVQKDFIVCKDDEPEVK